MPVGILEIDKAANFSDLKRDGVNLLTYVANYLIYGDGSWQQVEKLELSPLGQQLIARCG